MHTDYVFSANEFTYNLPREETDGVSLSEFLDGSQLTVARVTNGGLVHMIGRLGDDLRKTVVLLIDASMFEAMITAAALTVDFFRNDDAELLYRLGELQHLSEGWGCTEYYAVGGRFLA